MEEGEDWKDGRLEEGKSMKIGRGHGMIFGCLIERLWFNLELIASKI